MCSREMNEMNQQNVWRLVEAGAASTQRSALRVTLGVCLAWALSACGGGGGEDATAGSGSGGQTDGGAAVVSPSPDTGVGTSYATTAGRWLTTARNNALDGTSDEGVGGVQSPMFAVHPGMPTVGDGVRWWANSPVDSTVARISGGTVDATLTTLTGPSVRAVVWDQVDAGGKRRLYKMQLDVAATARPTPVQLSTQEGLCDLNGLRFQVAGQSLAGDDALITYAAPSASGSCDPAEQRPRAVRLSMAAADAPIELAAGTAGRVEPVAAIHGSGGRLAGFLAWRVDHFVRTDASLGQPVALDPANVAGTVTAASRPLDPGVLTKYGIFVSSADGVRRYDKSLDRLSAVLVPGRFNVRKGDGPVADDRALHITSDVGGATHLYRIEDTLAPAVLRLNTEAEGALHSKGFRVLKSSVLYATANSSAWTRWDKGTGLRSQVLDGHNVVLASTTHDRVFTRFLDSSSGTVQLAQSLPDGSERRSFGNRELLSAGLADAVSPYARHLSWNASFSHALLVLPAGTGSELRWLSFEAAAQDVLAGSVPSGLLLDAVPVWTAPSIVGATTLVGVHKAGTTASSYLLVAGRSPGALVRAADGL